LRIGNCRTGTVSKNDDWFMIIFLCAAAVFGDPHIITFDDYEYTFNGKGEFVLVHVDSQKLSLDVQGRFEQVSPNIYGDVSATHLTAVAGKRSFCSFNRSYTTSKHGFLCSSK